MRVCVLTLSAYTGPTKIPSLLKYNILSQSHYCDSESERVPTLTLADINTHKHKHTCREFLDNTVQYKTKQIPSPSGNTNETVTKPDFAKCLHSVEKKNNSNCRTQNRTDLTP